MCRMSFVSYQFQLRIPILVSPQKYQFQLQNANSSYQIHFEITVSEQSNCKFQMASAQGSHLLIKLSSMYSLSLSDICQFYF